MDGSIKFIKTNSALWNTVNQNNYLSNIVFIEDIKLIWTNDVYYGAETNKVKSVTVNELQGLKTTKSLIPGQIYEITDFRTTLDRSVGDAVYKDEEIHHIQVAALNNDTLAEDAKSILVTPVVVSRYFPPTGDFELIANKCDWDPNNSIYTEDSEYYKYVGETIEIDGTTYYIWNKYENGVRLPNSYGKSRVLTDTLDINCSIDNPYHIEYYISYEDEINPDYGFELPTEENNDPSVTDSFSRITRVDKPVYNYNIKMLVCDIDPNTGKYGLDEDSWYEYTGDTIDIDGVTYFIWYKYYNDLNGKLCIANCGLPLTTSLDIQCSPFAPYTPEYWLSVDTGELDDEYFDPEKTDIFYQIEYSNLPDGLEEIKLVFVETSVKFNLPAKSNFDESQIVNALAFKTKVADGNPPSSDRFAEVDYDSMFLYDGGTFDLDGKTYYIWDKWLGGFGELINGQYAIDEYGMYPQKILTDKLYIDCSLNKPYTADYSLTQDGETEDNYQFNHFGDSFVEIKYFNNVTNYIRFELNGWYVRCPELDRDGKFGWAYIDNTINTNDNSYVWVEGGGNEFGPFPAFMNTYSFADDDFFLTDTLDPQVGDSFRRNDEEDGELDTIDKVWGTIIEPPVSSDDLYHTRTEFGDGIYYMKDEFGNEAPYDFKHIKFNGVYTFGTSIEDYSLNGFKNKVYNNKILKPVNRLFNRINIVSKGTYANVFYPSCVDYVFDSPIKESLVRISDNGVLLIDANNIVENITWAELKSLRDNAQLVAGQQYRITDYVATTVQEETLSADHPFDIIVTADDEHTLNENARAILHDGDDYFANCDLASWELKYCLDNDTERFAWADSEGKGVVYYMKDEWNNECPYDFKGIVFSRYAIINLLSNDLNKVSEELVESLRSLFCFDRNNGLPMAHSGFHILNVDAETGNQYWCYTFNAKNLDTGVFYDASVICNKESIDDYANICENNVIKPYHDEYSGRPFLYRLNNIVFNNYFSVVDGFYFQCYFNTFDNNCHSNTFSHRCFFNTFGVSCFFNTFGVSSFSNTFGDNCYGNDFSGCSVSIFGKGCAINTFGNDCSSNTFGNYYRSNTFDNNCSNNTFGNNCDSNIFGNNCNSNTFGNDCSNNEFGDFCRSNTFDNDYFSNTFGNDCISNTFGSYCYSNTVGNDCNSNTFGNDCNSNTFGNNCDYNTFGDSCRSNTIGNNCRSNTIGNNCRSNTIGNNCNSNTISYSCQSNTFGNNCNSNTIGGSCQSNTFGYNCDSNTMGNDCSSNGFGDSCSDNAFNNRCRSNTFGYSCCSNGFGNSCSDNTFGNSCNDNTFGYSCSSNGFGDSCNDNTFGDSCNDNTFGNSCNDNTFGNVCYNTTFGNNCNSNGFGDSCNSNGFGDSCSSNTFGNSCSSNTFGDYYVSNTFGDIGICNTFGYNCSSNTFGDSCISNTFGDSCISNTFGNECSSNTFSDNCESNAFSDNCSSNIFGYNCVFNTFGDSCRSNAFGNECSYTKCNNYSKNITIENYAVQGSSSNIINLSELFPQIVQTTLPYKAYRIGLNSNGELVCSLSIIDNIEIGGRNLLTGTQSGKDWVGYTSFENGEFYIDNPTGKSDVILSGPKNMILEPGKYTISFEFKTAGFTSYNSGNNGVQIWILDNDYDPAFNLILQYSELSINEYKKYSCTFIANTKYDKAYIRIDNDGNADNTGHTELWVKNIKLEKGNKATDWTPAIEDIQNGYTWDAEKNSFAVGKNINTASGNYSFAEGFETIASGVASHSEGAKYENNRSTESAGQASHAEGASTYAKADGSHTEGILNTAGRFLDEISAAAQELGISGTQEELAAKLLGYGAHAEGMNNEALGSCSHAEGHTTKALANSTHAEGDTTIAFGEASHAEGYNTQAKGNQSHAEGSNTVAIGNSSHTEGASTIATGSFSHAEGSHTEASERDSHAEGAYNKAIGIASHAEGDHTIAEGEASHAEGANTIAKNHYEHAEGKFNISNHNPDDDYPAYNTISSIGIGIDEDNRKNAFEVMQNGDIYIIGVGDYDGTNFENSLTLQETIKNTINVVRVKELFEDVTPDEEITTQEIYDLYHYSDTSNGGKFYKIVNNKYVETNENIKPNIYYKWVDTLSADKKQETIDNGDGTTTIKDAFVLDLTFDTPQNQNILNEYMVEFISGSKIPGIQIKNVNSEKIYWNSKPSLLQNALHQIHIVNNLGVIVIGV